MEWTCLLGWCVMAADLAKDVAVAIEQAGSAGAVGAAGEGPAGEQAGEVGLDPGEIAKWIGLAVFIIAQALRR